MVVVHVSILVKEYLIEEFIRVTTENVKSSQSEPGVIRFDFLQESENPNQFLLIEIYRNNDDLNKHKDTIHYKVWRESVMKMMDEPRRSTKYLQLYPES